MHRGIARLPADVWRNAAAENDFLPAVGRFDEHGFVPVNIDSRVQRAIKMFIAAAAVLKPFYDLPGSRVGGDDKREFNDGQSDVTFQTVKFTSRRRDSKG